jgi:PAS domain S-box-containing protein
MFAALTVAASLLLMQAVMPPFRPLVLLLGVAVAAWSGGRIQGWLVMVLFILVARLFTSNHSDGTIWSAEKVTQLLFFVVICGTVIELIVARRQAEAAWRHVDRWNRLILETVREGIWVVDSMWRTVYVSDSMAALMNYAPGEMIGQDFEDFLADPNNAGALLDPRTRKPGIARHHEVRFRRGDGSRLWSSVVTMPIPPNTASGPGMLIMVGDISERRRAEQERDAALKALRIKEEQHGRLVESNIIGIISANLSGEITEANDAFLNMLGFTREDLRRNRLSWIDLTPAEYEARDHQAIDELWISGACTPYEKQFFREDGSRASVLIGAAALERYPRKWIGFVLDITERKRAEESWKEAKDAAEAASRAKDDFLAVLSHELRTPLTPVLVAATAMLDDPATPIEVRPMLEMTRRNIELEARLIDDLLDVTRISRGKLQLNKEVVDAHALIHQAVEICRDDIQAGGLELDLDLTAESHHVDADPARLQQVLWNLIKNAVKFTPAGGRLAIQSRQGDDLGLIVEVSDSGIGIEAAALPVIFDAFEQAEVTTRRRFGGLGLGLAISRAVTEMHGGRLSATSEGSGQGATFTLELATVPAPAPVVQERPPALQGQPTHRPLKILLVEDNKDTLRYLSWILTQHGHQVRAVDRLELALDAAGETSFDLVISDIELPDGSGLDLMRHLHTSRRIPAIAMSGFGSDEDIELSRASGFDEHLIKPVDFHRLSTAIRQLASEDPAGLGVGV